MKIKAPLVIQMIRVLPVKSVRIIRISVKLATIFTINAIEYQFLFVLISDFNQRYVFWNQWSSGFFIKNFSSINSAINTVVVTAVAQENEDQLMNTNWVSWKFWQHQVSRLPDIDATQTKMTIWLHSMIWMVECLMLLQRLLKYPIKSMRWTSLIIHWTHI